MNSLTYLSRQFDVLASTAVPSTPPSTPTVERASFVPRDGIADQEPHLKRTQTWSTRTLLIPAPGHVRSRKRSNSSPNQPRAPTSSSSPLSFSASLRKQSLSNPPTKAVGQNVRSRLYIVRLFVLICGWIYAAGAALVRRGFARTRHAEEEDVEAETSADEKESDDESRRDVASRMTLHPVLPLSPPPSPPPSVNVVPPAVSLTPPPDLPIGGSHSPNTLPDSLAPRVPPSSSSHPPAQATGSTSLPASSTPKTPFHRPKTLVLDLDETLIHSTTRPLFPMGSPGTGLLGLGGFGLGHRGKGAGHMVEVVLGGRSTLYHVYKRPFVDYFLRKVSGWYTLVIFTASMQEYADPVIDWLDAGRGILAHRLFRESCTQLPNGSYSKDLSIIESDLARVCLVDNSPVSYSINQANGIPIEGWTHDPADEALLDLLPVLDSLRFTSDVRHVLGIRGFS